MLMDAARPSDNIITSMDRASEPVDVTITFWRFVGLVATLSFDELCSTDEYAAMVAVADRRTSLLEGALLPSECGLALLRAANRASDAVLSGVRFDTENSVYVFDDCNALFLGAAELLRRAVHRHDERLNALERCLKRMFNTVSVIELADGLQGSSINT